MEYLVFPFGKYKGVKIKDLPSTYIVLALEKYELPKELYYELYCTLLGRLTVYSGIHYLMQNKDEAAMLDFLNKKIESYEQL
jgi:uncharacterized protein (DUF3820 family)